jgi:hypothetical protein
LTIDMEFPANGDVHRDARESQTGWSVKTFTLVR